MGNFELGDIYYIEKAFEDDPSKSKRRPAIIVDIDNNGKLLLLVVTTSQGRKNPPSHFDQFKHPILNWRKAGLDKPSWCLCYSLLKVPKEALLNYIGTLDDRDYDRLIDFLESL